MIGNRIRVIGRAKTNVRIGYTTHNGAERVMEITEIKITRAHSENEITRFDLYLNGGPEAEATVWVDNGYGEWTDADPYPDEAEECYPRGATTIITCTSIASLDWSVSPYETPEIAEVHFGEILKDCAGRLKLQEAAQ